MWTPDVRVRRGPDLDVVEGVSGILPERWGALCSVCGSSRGIVLRCSAGHCTLPFHALCGRNTGFYLAARGVREQCLFYAMPGDAMIPFLRIIVIARQLVCSIGLMALTRLPRDILTFSIPCMSCFLGLKPVAIKHAWDVGKMDVFGQPIIRQLTSCYPVASSQCFRHSICLSWKLEMSG